MNNRVLKEFPSSTGGLVQVFSWGLRHTAGKAYSGATVEAPADVAEKPRRGRPKKTR